MKTITQILNNSNNVAISQMKLIYKIWYSSIIDELKDNTTPYKYNPYEKSLVVLVHDNIWYAEMRYMEQEFIELLNNNDLELKKIMFKYKPKYENYKINSLINHDITRQAENFINATSNKFNNKILREYFRGYLINFFHYNNFNQWITKG